MKQYRAVYKYQRGLIRGAGASFVIAHSEEDARAQMAAQMPGVEITHIAEELEDPLRAYEIPRRGMVSVTLKGVEAPVPPMKVVHVVQPPECPGCGAGMNERETKRGHCDTCEQQRWDEQEYEARRHG